MFVDALRADSAALVAAARLGIDAKVPSCPAWTVADLVRHLGIIHRWVTELVRSGASERLPRDHIVAPSADEDLASWFDDGAGALCELLDTTGDDEAVWNWSATQPHIAEFWKRRMAHETAVHRWDAELAHGTTTPIPAELAKDGVTEMMDTVATTEAAFKPDATLGGSLHLHSTDIEGEWLVRIGGGKVEVSFEHGKGDAAVRGTAEDLLLFVWGRRGPEELETFGDAAVVANWLLFSR